MKSLFLSLTPTGVKKWSKKCGAALKHQDTISVKAWVKGMDTRIKSLGGEGVERFLANLFRAFDGLFESSSTPAKDAGKALNVMQRVRQIKAVSNGMDFHGAKSSTRAHDYRLRHRKKWDIIFTKLRILNCEVLAR